jgi:hypothetical protein
MVVLLRMDLRMELNKASQRTAKDLGRIGNELSDDEESDALPLDAMKRVTKSLSGLLPLLVADAPTARAFTQDKLDAGRKSLADAMGDPETCGAIFRALDYLCKRDPGAVVDKATKNAWRWFCETHYNDGRGDPVESEKRNRAAERRASSSKGQYELFWGLVDKSFEDAKNTHCDDRLCSVVSASDFEIMTSGFVWMREI